MAALALLGFVIAAREPTYLPPPGEQIDILLELAGVFPDKYGIMWREHGILRSTDPAAQLDPSLLRAAQFMHNLTTGGARTEGDIHVEVAYRFYAHDHEIPNESVTLCACDTLTRVSTSCLGRLAFGNYEFTLSVNYNNTACTDPVDPKRVAEFERSMQTADRLIALYLKPLRRKPSWL